MFWVNLASGGVANLDTELFSRGKSAMNFYKAGLAVLTAVLSFGALAEGGDRTCS